MNFLIRLIPIKKSLTIFESDGKQMYVKTIRKINYATIPT